MDSSSNLAKHIPTYDDVIKYLSQVKAADLKSQASQYQDSNELRNKDPLCYFAIAEKGYLYKLFNR
ncbi:hypothetical protein BOO92_13860 [Vibrio navarrensis]|uniref:hypothetical protein n=1 Tax=Vibrio TaxID=662 RepID=UPI001865A935|nr:hypothetical protein [Vibrio navarrensis]HAS6102122.1 hypothetical protein [Vibrio vulnificus]EHA1127106.1 hypothetical protein [Vibrio navarrensis]MBE3657763.1 hypothetical protein [Vibrio navarrensis]MBH9739929.1 hypothetical protein [Vibrio navarrensis]HDY8122778.1 hypothetical protein [Vibrio vulnificus]